MSLLNPDQFTQPLLFNVSGMSGPSSQAPTTGLPGEDYPNPHVEDEDRLISPNPIYSKDPVPEEWDLARLSPDTTEEWVPSWKIKSIQDSIHEPAVEHLATNATGTTEGNVTIVQGDEGSRGESWLFDGNHRTNAALRRGQMFVPANVMRAPRRR